MFKQYKEEIIFGGDKINKSESDEQINTKTTKLIILTLLLTYLFLLWRERRLRAVSRG